MSYLIDTHALIWYFEDSPDIPEKVKMIIDSDSTKKFISVASLWEIAIKMSIGKLTMELHFDEILTELENSDLLILQVENNYLKKVFGLPFLHKDPFDRLIIATALIENLTIITIDENVQKYDAPWVW